MVRMVTAAAAAVMLVLAGFFVWKSRASAEDPIPPVPKAQLASAYAQPATGFAGKRAFRPPEASERSKEEKRFARADRDNDGRIVLAELLEPRRKAFAKLDADGNGQLSFEEWTGRTSEKFAEADADRSGWLTPAEYATTRPKTRAKPPRCACT